MISSDRLQMGATGIKHALSRVILGSRTSTRSRSAEGATYHRATPQVYRKRISPAALKARPVTAWGNAPGLPQANQSGSAEGATYHSLGQRPTFTASESVRSAEGATYHSLGQRPRFTASESITQR